MWKTVDTELDVYSSEVYVAIDRVSVPDNKPSQFVRVNYMDVKPGKAGGYVEVESDLWKPVHAADQPQSFGLEGKAGGLEEVGGT